MVSASGRSSRRHQRQYGNCAAAHASRGSSIQSHPKGSTEYHCFECQLTRALSFPALFWPHMTGPSCGNTPVRSYFVSSDLLGFLLTLSPVEA